MKKQLSIFFSILLLAITLIPLYPAMTASAPEAEGVPVVAADVADTYYRATVTRVVDSGVITDAGETHGWQTLELAFTTGPETGKTITLDNGKSFVIGTYQAYGVGQTLVLAKPTGGPEDQSDFYYIVDSYRGTRLLVLTLIFLALAIYFGRKRGLTSVVGMLFSVLIIFYWIIPRIVVGKPAFATTIMGAMLIIVVSLYLSHGCNRRTSIALVSTLLALGVAVLLDVGFVHFAGLLGTGTEEAFYLQFNNGTIDLRGLLLGGIIIGVLGVLDDVTTGQAAAVEEIAAASGGMLSFRELYRRGLSIGREHIASLINTLVLAYVGASFPLLLLYSNQTAQPLWVTLNSNFIAEEMVRTLVGSSVLVIAVPLTTFLAALWYAGRKQPTV